MRLALSIMLFLALASPSLAESVAAIYYTPAGEIAMVVIPDDKAQLTDPINAAAFAPKGVTRVILPLEMYEASKNDADIKAASAGFLNKSDPTEAALASKLQASVTQFQAAEEAKAKDAALAASFPVEIEVEVAP